METFPFYSDDEIVVGGLVGWKSVYWAGVYRDTQGFPYQWTRGMKRSKPVSDFITSAWRGKKVDQKKCWYGCELTFKPSAN